LAIAYQNNFVRALGQRAAALVTRCGAQNIPIMLSPIVVAELLCGVAEGKETEFLQIVKKRFVSPNFDDICSLKFAQIWRANQERRRDLQKEGLSRNLIRMDWLIVASALAHQVEYIFSDDKHVHSCAQGLIEVRYLAEEPIPAQQESIPLE
ncbi:MAG: hypothetical protein WBO46_16040, partial [Caldilineaceae bacterium]